MPGSVEIVLPCYNPPNDWFAELLKFYNHARQKVHVHFILVNDGSTNLEFEKALPLLEKEKVPFRFISYTANMGKGYALRKGVEASSMDQIVYTDVDFPFTNDSMMRVIELIQTGDADVIAGDRDSTYYRHSMSGFRKILSKAFRFILRVFLRMTITDTQCGLKAFNQKGKQEFLKTRINRYLFDFEFIYRCSKTGEIKVRPVPVELKTGVRFSKMRLKVLAQETVNLFSVILLRKV
ncbi:MAG TPA: glycosyltransferase [Bacteroidia bacterium]|nr:glycosyltransferase [Bacteroidia bacterium]